MAGAYCNLAVLGLLLLTSCGQPEARAAERVAGTASAPLRGVPGSIDSLILRDEALRRFREGLPPVDSLAGGMTSRDSLVLVFVHALEHADTARLSALAVTKPEFAYLYYPTAREGLPPYDVSPGLSWFLTFGRSERGLRKALQKRGGQPLGYLDYRCADTADIQGKNRLWGGCVVRRMRERGDTIQEMLFAQILERDGRYKFLNYANRID